MVTDSAVRRYRVLVLAVVALVAVIYTLTRRAGHAWGDDFSQYLQHALNILHGLPYKHTGHVLNPQNQIAPEVYPPLFPLLLAPVVAAVGPLDLETLKLVGIGCTAVLLLVGGVYLETVATSEGLPAQRWPYQLLPLLVVFAASSVVWQQKDDILSDIPFVLMQQLALLAVATWRNRADGNRLTLARAALLGIVLYLPYGARTLGLLLIGAFALETIWRHRRQPFQARYEAFALLISGLLIVAQRLWLNSHDAGYGQQLRDYFSAAQVWANAKEYWAIACRFWGTTPSLTRFQYTALGTGLAVLAIRGGARQWRRQPWQTPEIYFAAYLIVLLLWPMPQGARFLLPLLPQTVIYVWLGARSIPGRTGQWLPTALAIILLAAGLADIRRLASQPVPDRHDTPETARLFAWVRQQPPTAMSLFWKPRALYLYTGHPALAPTDLRDSTATEADIRRVQARFLILQRADSVYRPVRARLRYESVHWQVFEVN